MIRRALAAAVALVVAAALLLGCQQVRNSGNADLPPPDGSVRIATYNVHYIRVNATSGRWSAANWERRKAPMDAVFKAIDADLVAFQEMESFAGGNEDSNNLARTWLLDQNPGYRAAAIGDWQSFPSTQPILYRADRWRVEEQGWFFFSDTPEVIYSRTFDGSYPAFASWADFRPVGGGAGFRLLNVHLDYSSSENRVKSTELVSRRVASWIAEGKRVILAGDLNARLGSDLHDMLGEAGLSFVPVQGATYHFDRGLNLFGAIDHIGYSGSVELASGPYVYREKHGEVWATDHYPVIADFRLSIE